MSIGTMKMADGLPATFVAGSGKQITNSGGFALCLAGVKKAASPLPSSVRSPSTPDGTGFRTAAI